MRYYFFQIGYNNQSALNEYFIFITNDYNFFKFDIFCLETIIGILLYIISSVFAHIGVEIVQKKFVLDQFRHDFPPYF